VAVPGWPDGMTRESPSFSNLAGKTLAVNGFNQLRIHLKGLEIDLDFPGTAVVVATQ
jgi:hypothetical protein